MKLGTENKTKTGIAAVLVVVAALALYNWVFTSQDAATANTAADRGCAVRRSDGSCEKPRRKSNR